MPEREFLPNLFLLGAAKCGTTTLHACLDDMPDVCMSRPKEPHFFEAEFERGLDFYQRQYFAHWQGEPVIGEARHRNLYLPYVPERIHQTNPDARLVVLVRDPVERACSHWYHYYWQQRETLSFREAIQVDWARIQQGLRGDTPEEMAEYSRHLSPDERGNTGYGIYRTYIDTGYYHEQIRRYLALFPASQLRVILFEDLISRPEQVLADLVEFLGLAPERNTPRSDRWENAANPPYWMKRIYERGRVEKFAPNLLRRLFRRWNRWQRRRLFDAGTREWLRDHYREHNRALAEFLGRDLSAWE